MTLTAEQKVALRRRARLNRIGLAFHEEWPLFSVTKHIVEETRQVWAHVDGMAMPPAFHSHPDFLRHLLDELRHLEYRLLDEGLVGWIVAIRKGNHRMRRWTEAVGASLYAEDETRWYFRKVAGNPILPTSPKNVVQSMMRGGQIHERHAHA